jgi:hypothetical protein
MALEDPYHTILAHHFLAPDDPLFTQGSIFAFSSFFFDRWHASLDVHAWHYTHSHTHTHTFSLSTHTHTDAHTHTHTHTHTHCNITTVQQFFIHIHHISPVSIQPLMPSQHFPLINAFLNHIYLPSTPIHHHHHPKPRHCDNHINVKELL